MVNILQEIQSLPPKWHHHGSVSDDVLKEIYALFEKYPHFCSSCETGCGRTTLLLSRLSKNHLVFCLDDGDSYRAVRDSELLQRNQVSFVEGPTQKTLPSYAFGQPFDFILIDGPHAFPFPELEYYFLYPHLKPGGILVLDDINIPSIQRMLQILAKDDMFEVVKTIHHTAFLRRTDAPVFDPYGDGWWEQGFNRKLSELKQGRKSLLYNFCAWLWKKIPERLRARVPSAARVRFSSIFSR